MFSKVLIANRGAIACRILRTLRRLGIRSVAVYSDADHAICTSAGGRSRADRRRAGGRELLRGTGSSMRPWPCGREAIHPGYGFLSENADFAEACERRASSSSVPPPSRCAPSASSTRRASWPRQRRAAAAGQRACSPTSNAALAEAARIGYPVMLKSTAGGGGIGMQLVRGAGRACRGV